MSGGFSESKGELWLPGQPLDHVYPVPGTDELIEHWAETHGHADVIEAPGVFGAVRQPEEEVGIVASIDLCEVVRGTLHSMLGVYAKDEADIQAYSSYGPNFDIDGTRVVAIVQALMNHGHVKPVEGIERIASTLRTWRLAGVYCVANTSTLPGCEKATIEFLDEYLEGCFDGVLLPRNHDGSGPITKGHALGFVTEAFVSTEGFALHIDDAPHHCEAVQAHVGELLGEENVATVMPLYPGNGTPPGNTIPADSPVHAFEIADSLVSERL